MTTLSEITSKEVLLKHPLEEYHLAMDFAPWLEPGESLASVTSVTAILLDADGNATLTTPNIVLANAQIATTRVRVHVSEGNHLEVYRLVFLVVTSDGNTKAALGLLHVRSDIAAKQIRYKQPAESILYSMPFTELLETGDSLDTVVSVTAYRLNGIYALTGDDVHVTVGTGAINDTSMEARISGGNATEIYRVEFVNETANGDIRVASGILVIEDK